jgi:hypothetical protein
MPSGRAPSAQNRLRRAVGSQRLLWRWNDEPAASARHFAMKVMATPLSAAISFAPCLYSVWRSAISTGVV